MPLRNPAVPLPRPRHGLALAAVLSLALPIAFAGDNGEVTLQCRFPSGLSAVYILNRNEARVRRADLLQPREGRVQATVAEYRFIFQERDSAYRIDVIIDRATGNTRRVFGTERNMGRMPEPGNEGSGLVYEAGQCEGQYAALRAWPATTAARAVSVETARTQPVERGA